MCQYCKNRLLAANPCTYVNKHGILINCRNTALYFRWNTDVSVWCSKPRGCNLSLLCSGRNKGSCQLMIISFVGPNCSSSNLGLWVCSQCWSCLGGGGVDGWLVCGLVIGVTTWEGLRKSDLHHLSGRKKLLSMTLSGRNLYFSWREDGHFVWVCPSLNI